METENVENTQSHTPLPTENRISTTTALAYELGGVKLDSYTANKLLEQ
jgi:hypothetical protein